MKVILVFFIIVLWGCGSNTQLPNEGVVEYKIEYLDSPKEQPLVGYLPNVMTVAYNQDNTHTQIEGFMGLFSLSFISKPKENKHYTLLRVMDKKIYYEAPTNDLAFGYKGMSDIKIRYLNETREIAGSICNKAIATSSKMNFVPLVIYYTYELNINQPNKHTPFQEIDGVLMAFQVNIENINMKFEATSINKQKIDSTIFEIPNEYKKVSYQRMKEMINMFNEKS